MTTYQKLTKQQKILIGLMIINENMELGEISQQYFTSKSTRNSMKRNSKMASWLGQLEDKELVKISHYPKVTYSVTEKAILLLTIC